MNCALLKLKKRQSPVSIPDLHDAIQKKETKDKGNSELLGVMAHYIRVLVLVLVWVT